MFALPLRAAVLLGLWALCDAQSGSLCVAGTTESISNIKMDFSESSMIYNNLGGQGGAVDDNDDDPLEIRHAAAPRAPRCRARTPRAGGDGYPPPR
jgi:hypothetical protein